jgi:hypothetical protein
VAVARRCPTTGFAVMASADGHYMGTTMADHSEVAYTTADGNDYVAHEATYEGFIKLVKYGSAVVAFIVIMMAIFLT